MDPLRDRKCDLVGKDNVPLEELSSSETCLGDYISERTAEIAAAKGDPKKVFGRHLALTRAAPTPTPSISASRKSMRPMLARISSGNRVSRIDSEITERDAHVNAAVEMVVLSPFAACSPIATGCTGTCWDISGQAKPTPGSRESFPVAHKVERSRSRLGFRRTTTAAGAAALWRCRRSRRAFRSAEVHEGFWFRPGNSPALTELPSGVHRAEISWVHGPRRNQPNPEPINLKLANLKLANLKLDRPTS